MGSSTCFTFKDISARFFAIELTTEHELRVGNAELSTVFDGNVPDRQRDLASHSTRSHNNTTARMLRCAR